MWEPQGDPNPAWGVRGSLRRKMKGTVEEEKKEENEEKENKEKAECVQVKGISNSRAGKICSENFRQAPPCGEEHRIGGWRLWWVGGGSGAGKQAVALQGGEQSYRLRA